MRKKLFIIAAVALIFWPGNGHGQINTTNFFNWETIPVHPVALSPDGNTLAVCNLPDNRLELFDVTSGIPVAKGSIPVGLDPVTVRFRTASEAWVVNYISDSVSIIDVPSQRVFNTLTTSNEPSDVVFASSPPRAYISCGQPNLVQVFDPASLLLTTNLAIDGNRPRAMDVSPDGSKVYVAIFESGNASTIIGPGISQGLPRPSPVNFPNAPSLGLNPPPNAGTNFIPLINPVITNPPPRVGLIVKKNSANRWMDDNSGDWTEYIRGTNAAFTGRIPGWDLPDHDLAVVDTANLSIHYATGLMNICMALAVNPASGTVSVIGTDALNNLRFQPVLQGIFIRVNLAQVNPSDLTSVVSDLNPHLTYQTRQVSMAERNKSIGDPRGIVWNSAGTRGYVTGLGSDNLVIIDANGNRVGLNPSIDLGRGPTGLALDEARNRLYIYNRFEGSVTSVDLTAEKVVDTHPFFDPTPPVINAGRRHLYNTHQTSGLGQLACASCHVDTRFDRLAWDLGDPTDVAKVITNINFVFSPASTNNFHPMKGPMTTQTLQDIIGHEPFHWRGDRDSIEQFDSTFTNLQAATSGLATNEMAEFKSFLATVRFPPNPFRQFDNSLTTNLPLPGFFALGRGASPAGTQLSNGNPQSGQNLFRLPNASIPQLANVCTTCHTIPTGLGSDRQFIGSQWVSVPLATNSAHHIASIELERSAQLPFKVPQLRNMADKFGLDLMHTNSRAGFGFSHDGSVDSLVRFIQDGFGVTDDQATADLVSFVLSLSGSGSALTGGTVTDPNHAPGVASLDTPAAVGRQITIKNPATVPLIDSMISLANSSASGVDLVVKGFKAGIPRGWFYDRTTGKFLSDRQSESETASSLRSLAADGAEQTYTIVPGGSGRRLGIDRDADGYLDRDELDFGSDPANPLSLATNTPPRLGVVPISVAALKGHLLTLNFTAVDDDIPAQILTFSLAGNSPPGAAIDPVSGLFNWIPTGPPGVLTNTVTVVVTDHGTPNKSDQKTFTITAADLGASASFNSGGMLIGWNSIPGLIYRVQYKNNLNDPAWIDWPAVITATNTLSLLIDPAVTNGSRFYRVRALP